ncbi:hypothetical protein, partial [Listeria monocytogenes]|uniref:hypothetical protein n=1 Tax=Listeria monocytogenes TaxID=1639 RepID=UPI002FDBC969
FKQIITENTDLKLKHFPHANEFLSREIIGDIGESHTMPIQVPDKAVEHMKPQLGELSIPHHLNRGYNHLEKWIVEGKK